MKLHLRPSHLLLTFFLGFFGLVIPVSLYLVQTDTNFTPRAQTAFSPPPTPTLTSTATIEASLAAKSATFVGSAMTAQSAEVRSKELIQVLESNPASFFNYVLTPEQKAQIPVSVQPYIESDVSVEGEVKAVQFDTFTKGEQSRMEYYLETLPGTRMKLHFVGDIPPTITTGTRIGVQGVKIQNHIAVPAFTQTTQNYVPKILSQPAKQTVTTKKVAVILFKFADDPTGERLFPSAGDIQKWIYTDKRSVRSYVKEISGGQWTIAGVNDPVNGDVWGAVTPYRSLLNRDDCDYYKWIDTLDKTLLVNIAGKYHHYIYIFPNTACYPSYRGWAEANGTKSWIQADSAFFDQKPYDIISHELGHNFGVNHANSSYECKDALGQPVFWSENCRMAEYGDPYDVMGHTPYGLIPRHMNTFHKGNIGWIPKSKTHTIAKNGTYKLGIAEKVSSYPQTIRILRKAATETKPAQYYYLEYRQPFGLFDNFSASDPKIKGVFLRLASDYTEQFPRQTILLDANPVTPELDDAALQKNKTIDDTYAGIKIKTVDLSGTFATVQISFYPPLCQPEKPNLELDFNARFIGQGSYAGFPFTLANLDTPGCSESQFTVSAQTPPGIELQEEGQSVLSLHAGASLRAGLSFFIRQTTPPGVYPVTLRVSHSAGTQYTQTVPLTITVQAAPPRR